MKFLFLHPHVGAFFIAFFLVDIITPVVRYLAQKIGALDYPNFRKIHKEPIPVLGGLALYLGFTLAVISTLDYNRALIGIIFASSIIVIMGIVDDIRNISALIKLFILFLIIFALARIGLVVESVPSVFKLNLFFTLFWVAYIISSFNAIDNMDGSSAGVAFTSAFIFYVISYQTGQTWMGYLAISLAGACIGFLRYNFLPAKIFMGDSGSFFIGFILAEIAVMGEWAKHNEPLKAVIIPTLILGVPIYDLTLTTILRYKNKKIKSIKEAIRMSAKDHLSHRLMLCFNLTQRETVFLIYLLSLILGGITLVIYRLPTSSVVLTSGVVLLLLILLGKKLDIKIDYEEGENR